MSVWIDHCQYIVPKNMGIYIPAHVDHSAQMRKKTRVQSIRFPEQYLKPRLHEPQLIHLSSLAQQVIQKICKHSEQNEHGKSLKNLLSVLWDEISTSAHCSYSIKIPQEPRLRKVYEWFLQCHDTYPSLNVCAKKACVDGRTLTRLFLKETGMNFITWKQQFIFVRAIELLSIYQQTKQVAYRLGYRSEAAFISFFKKISGGKKPSDFFKNRS